MAPMEIPGGPTPTIRPPYPAPPLPGGLMGAPTGPRMVPPSSNPADIIAAAGAGGGMGAMTLMMGRPVTPEDILAVLQKAKQAPLAPGTTPLGPQAPPLPPGGPF